MEVTEGEQQPKTYFFAQECPCILNYSERFLFVCWTSAETVKGNMGTRVTGSYVRDLASIEAQRCDVSTTLQ